MESRGSPPPVALTTKPPPIGLIDIGPAAPELIRRANVKGRDPGPPGDPSFLFDLPERSSHGDKPAGGAASQNPTSK